MFLMLQQKIARELRHKSGEKLSSSKMTLTVCYIFGFTKAGAKGKEDMQPMKGTSLTDISDSGNTNSTVP